MQIIKDSGRSAVGVLWLLIAVAAMATIVLIAHKIGQIEDPTERGLAKLTHVFTIWGVLNLSGGFKKGR